MRNPTSSVFGTTALVKGLVAAGSLLVSASALAATTWTFDVPPTNTGNPVPAQCTQTSPSSITNGNNVSCFTSSPTAGGTPTVTATGWANTGQTSGATAGGNSTGWTLQSGYVTIYPNYLSGGSGSGIGEVNRDYGTSFDTSEGSSPEHAIDNSSTNSPTTTISQNNAIYDMVLMEFSSAVTLTGLTVGWSANDTDVTVMACEGAGTNCLNFKNTATAYSGLAALGWTYVEHSASNGATTGSRLINGATNADTAAANSVSSKYWLIGTYNPTVGTADRLSGAGSSNNTVSNYLNVGNDSMKLLALSAVTVNPPSPPGGVPEPASLALLSIAGLGFIAARKRSARAN